MVAIFKQKEDANKISRPGYVSLNSLMSASIDVIYSLEAETDHCLGVVFPTPATDWHVPFPSTSKCALKTIKGNTELIHFTCQRF